MISLIPLCLLHDQSLHLIDNISAEKPTSPNKVGVRACSQDMYLNWYELDLVLSLLDLLLELFLLIVSHICLEYRFITESSCTGRTSMTATVIARILLHQSNIVGDIAAEE